MGYYTQYYIEMEEITDKEVNELEILNKMKEICPDIFYDNAETFEECLEEELKWYDYSDDIIRLSKVFPTVLFTLTGYGEEQEDIWKHYFYNGKDQFAKAKLHFENCELI